jgi:hypothetical protein
MNTQIAKFLWTAARRDILTPGQCLVLRDLLQDVFGDEGTLDNYVGFIEEHRLLDENKMEALRLLVEAGAKRVSLDTQELDQDIEEVISRELKESVVVWEPNPGLDWFCCLAVQKGILTRDACLVLVADLDEACDLLGFAQSMINMGFCRDIAEVQKLIDQSLELWARGDSPPFSVFAEGGEQDA